jgi:hypothetical protein
LVLIYGPVLGGESGLWLSYRPKTQQNGCNTATCWCTNSPHVHSRGRIGPVQRRDNSVQHSANSVQPWQNAVQRAPRSVQRRKNPLRRLPNSVRRQHHPIQAPPNTIRLQNNSFEKLPASLGDDSVGREFSAMGVPAFCAVGVFRRRIHACPPLAGLVRQSVARG